MFQPVKLEDTEYIWIPQKISRVVTESYLFPKVCTHFCIVFVYLLSYLFAQFPVGDFQRCWKKGINLQQRMISKVMGSKDKKAHSSLPLNFLVATKGQVSNAYFHRRTLLLVLGVRMFLFSYVIFYWIIALCWSLIPRNLNVSLIEKPRNIMGLLHW